MVGSQAPYGVKCLRADCDILEPKSVEQTVAIHQPTHLLHLAGLVDIDECEKNPNRARAINENGTRIVAQICKKYGVVMIYVSSCAIFDGTTSTPYHEDDTPHPINWYGLTKLGGEQEVKKYLDSYVIIRTGWLFGGGFGVDKNIILRFYDSLIRGNVVTAVSDRFGSPTYVSDLYAALKILIDKDMYGIYHIVNEGCVSYYDMALMIKRYIGRGGDVRSCTQEAIRAIAPTRRGTMEALCSKKIVLRPWHVALREYISTLARTKQSSFYIPPGQHE